MAQYISKFPEDLIVIDYKNGISISEIKFKYSIGSADTIYQILNRHKVELRNNCVKLNNMEIKERFLNGESRKQIANACGVCTNVINNKLRKQGIKNPKYKYNLIHDFFSNINSEEKAYVLGLLCADGHISHKRNTISLSLQEQDKDLLIRIRDLLFPDKDKPLQTSSSKEGSIHNRFCKASKKFVLWACSSQLHQDYLRLRNFQYRKSSLEKIPQIPQQLIKHFIRGYFDGDGSLVLIKTNKFYDPRIQISVYENFGLNLKTIIMNEISIKMSLYKMPDNISRLDIMKTEDVIAFLSWIYQDASIFLNRKYEKYLKLIKP